MSAEQILNEVLAAAIIRAGRPSPLDPAILERLDFVCRSIQNRAGVRLLMACLLAKLDQPRVDPRKPYTEIGTPDSFSGRTYDEQYLTRFISNNRLPCNSTTAFLTPALRNINQPLTTEVQLIGRPRELYVFTLELLDDVYNARVSPRELLIESVRILLELREERQQRLDSLKQTLRLGTGTLPLGSAEIVSLIAQHLSLRNASRLPVLVVAAAYRAAGARLGEWTRPLNAHNAADLQTGAFGDVEVCLVGEMDVVTAYEMKDREVTREDINVAITKVADKNTKIDNYIFITTERIPEEVTEYASTIYREIGGTEIAILDCIGFLRHFLHLFHRRRVDFLEAYQDLVLAEPESAVSFPLKEAFLSLRQAAEADA